MKAERWDEKHWDDTDHERTGRGKDTVMLMLNHAQNHLWREVWPAAPRDGARGLYWSDVRSQVHRARAPPWRPWWYVNVLKCNYERSSAA